MPAKSGFPDHVLRCFNTFGLNGVGVEIMDQLDVRSSFTSNTCIVRPSKILVQN